MKKMYFQQDMILPNLDNSFGQGSIEIPAKLYHEYQFKLEELISLAQQINNIAREQGMDIRGDH